MDFANVNRVKQKTDDPVERYREYVEFQLDFDGEGLGLREAREVLRDLNRDGDVVGLDMSAIGSIVENDYINPALLQDDPAQPLEKWWWHLGAIRRREFPAEKLPAALRPAYLS